MSSIPREKKLEIEKTVDRIFLDTGLSYPENNLLQISTALNADVVEAELADFNEKKVKGYIRWFEGEEKETNKPFTAKIYLNSNQSATVKNFTLAHELGHFLLHKGENNFRIDLQDYSPEGDPLNQETEANYFAGSLLMPKVKLLAAFEKASSLDDVAKAFAVSRPAVEARLKWLGLILSS